MLVFSALTLESFASRVVANNAACVAGDARPSGPACFLPERRLAGLVVGDPTVKNPTLFSNPLPSSTLPAFIWKGAKEMSPPAANSLSSEFY